MRHASPWMELLTCTIFVTKGDKPDFTFQINNSRQKVTAWSRMYGNGILLGSYFLKEMLMEKLPRLNEHFHNQLKIDMF